MVARTRLAIAWLAFSALVSACGPALGPVFRQPQPVGPYEAVIYLYRPSKFIGAAVSYEVRMNGMPVTRLYNGGYFPIVTRPGVVELSASTESTSMFRVHAPPGHVQYVRGTVNMGFFVGRPHLQQVDPAEALPEIMQCGLIPPPQGFAPPPPLQPPPPPAPSPPVVMPPRPET